MGGYSYTHSLCPKLRPVSLPLEITPHVKFELYLSSLQQLQDDLYMRAPIWTTRSPAAALLLLHESCCSPVATCCLWRALLSLSYLLPVSYLLPISYLLPVSYLLSIHYLLPVSYPPW